MKLVKTIFKTISSVIFAFLMILVTIIIIYVARVNYLSSNGRVNEVKINFYTILTQSMWPNIKAGDIIVTYKTDNNVYEQGDIITFVSDDDVNGGITITHRIDRVYFEGSKILYRTKGDNNNVADSKGVDPSKVIGKVVMKIPKAGYIQQFLVTKIGWIAVVVIPCFGVLVYDLLKLLKRIFRRRKRIPNIKEDIEKTLNFNELHQILENNNSITNIRIEDENNHESNFENDLNDNPNEDTDIYSTILISDDIEKSNDDSKEDVYAAILSSDIESNNISSDYSLNTDDVNMPHLVDLKFDNHDKNANTDTNDSLVEVLNDDDSDIEIL